MTLAGNVTPEQLNVMTVASRNEKMNLQTTLGQPNVPEPGLTPEAPLALSEPLSPVEDPPLGGDPILPS